MASLTEKLYYSLEERISATTSGTRLPSVRQMMREYNVSQITVVNALNMLKEQGYIESRIGDGTYTTGLLKKRINNRLLRIGLATHDFPSSAHYDLIRSIKEYCISQGHQVFLHHFQWDSHDPFPNHNWRIDAAMVLSCQTSFSKETMTRMKKLKIPLVILDRLASETGFDSVSLDNYKGGQIAAQHLINAGHRKIAVLSAQPSSLLIRQRIQGFLDYAAESGIALPQLFDCRAKDGDDSSELAYRKIAQLTEKRPDFTGLFCTTDYNALGAISALNQNGFTVPQDVSVIGFDNVSMAQFLQPPLTTFNQNHQQWGRAALELIEKQCNKAPANEPQNIFITPDLIKRDSVSRPYNGLTKAKHGRLAHA